MDSPMQNISYITSKNSTKTYYVYALLNEYGALEYIGQTTNLKRRMIGHMQKPQFNKTGSLANGRFHGRSDITMETVAEFDTAQEARAFEGQLKTELGFEWTEFTTRQKNGKKNGRTQGARNRDSGHLAKIGREANIKKRQPVLAYIKATGEFVGEFESQREAAIQLGLHQGSINSVLKGRYSHTGGYYFELKEEIK